MTGKYTIITLKELESTNDFAKSLIAKSDAEHFTVIVAENQIKGRGQRGNVWQSQQGKNLTFSVIIKPLINAKNQFYISKVVSLALLDIIDKYTENVSIKWPNDIYVDNKKIAGILIENIIQANRVNTSIIGIGLNVNQEIFDKTLLNPVSLKQITGNIINKENLLNSILNNINNFTKIIDNKELIDKLYLNRLFGFNQELLFKNKNNQKFKAIIKNISYSGKLILQIGNNLQEFDFKEIIFLF